MRRFFGFLVFVFALSAMLTALYVWKAGRSGQSVGWSFDSPFHAGKFTVAQGPAIDLKSVDTLAAMSRQRVLLAKAVVPSVVSITTTKNIPLQQRQRRMQDPLYRFFHGGGDDNGQDNADGDNVAQRALGSGVIVSKEGHILTNYHVVDGMDQIDVELSDGRRARAKLIGTDPQTDLAVLKIEEKDDLPPLALGDSDKVEVGETVIAVGNPYGLEETVTQGIISAKGREVNVEALNEFFQTDAAINPGNSGGALINVNGELIGINSAISTSTGAFEGVGFAIPSNVARRVLDSLVKTGRVIRGYLGVTLQQLTPEDAQSLNLPDDQGAFVSTVQPDSPAAKADLKPGDFIRKYNNKPVRTLQDLRRGVAGTDVDSTVPIEFLRDGKTMSATVRIAEQPRNMQALQRNLPIPPGGGGKNKPGGGNNNNDENSGGVDSGALAGVQVGELTPRRARQLSLPDNVTGVVVTNVNDDSPAADSLQRGDIIEAVNQQPVASVADYDRLVSALQADKRVLLSIIRDRVRSFVVVNPQ